jgi:hypothetical protein
MCHVEVRGVGDTDSSPRIPRNHEGDMVSQLSRFPSPWSMPISPRPLECYKHFFVNTLHRSSTIDDVGLAITYLAIMIIKDT